MRYGFKTPLIIIRICSILQRSSCVRAKADGTAHLIQVHLWDDPESALQETYRRKCMAHTCMQITWRLDSDPKLFGVVKSLSRISDSLLTVAGEGKSVRCKLDRLGSMLMATEPFPHNLFIWLGRSSGTPTRTRSWKYSIPIQEQPWWVLVERWSVGDVCPGICFSVKEWFYLVCGSSSGRICIWKAPHTKMSCISLLLRQDLS